jgi:hypothetical protein
MTPERQENLQPVAGDEFAPALGKLWGMLLVFLLMIPAGAIAALCWWLGVELPGGRVLSDKAGIAGLIAIPLGGFLALVIAAFLLSAKRLVLAEHCVQMQSRGRVAVHIPYANIAHTSASGEAGAGVIALRLRDRQDPETLVPTWTKDQYEIQVLVYREPMDAIFKRLNERLAAFRVAPNSPKSITHGEGHDGQTS